MAVEGFAAARSRWKARAFSGGWCSRLVGVLVEVGRGGMRTRRVDRLAGRTLRNAGKLTAPASVLFLERVFYKGDTRDIADKGGDAVGHTREGMVTA